MTVDSTGFLATLIRPNWVLDLLEHSVTHATDKSQANIRKIRRTRPSLGSVFLNHRDALRPVPPGCGRSRGMFLIQETLPTLASETPARKAG
jgi:hypothetical protein